MAAWEPILRALYLFLPAFVANMSPVLTSRLFPKWRTPIDFGSVHADGERLLGDGKTWRGLLLGGVAAGATAVGIVLWPLPIPGLESVDFGRSTGASLWGVFLFGFTMGAFALTGDAVESFFKRRSGRERGAPWIPFDQLDFVVFGLLAAFIWYPMLGSTWAISAYSDPWTLGTLVIGTPALHLLVNRVGYWLKLKDVPW